MINRCLITFAVLLIGVFAAGAQNGAGGGNGVLINPKQPPVYLEFVKSGVCVRGGGNFNFGDLCTATEPNVRRYEAFWLRLVNNTKWSVGLTLDKGATAKNATPVVIDSTTFVTQDGTKAAYGTMLANRGAEMDVVYKSEAETGCDFSKPAPKGDVCFRINVVRPEIPLPALSSSVFVAPGQSVIFPVDRTHVIEYVNLYVLYNFSWEYSGEFYSAFPQYDSHHRAYFGWFALEKALKAEREKKTTG